MGWHCITVWECELTPQKKEQTLKSLVYTLNHIFLLDHTTSCQIRINQAYGEIAEPKFRESDEKNRNEIST